MWMSGFISMPEAETIIRVRHAKRGSIEERISLNEFFVRCEPYFAKSTLGVSRLFRSQPPPFIAEAALVRVKAVKQKHRR